MTPSVGEVFLDPDGTQLLDHMIEIFSRSFGYTAEPSVRLGASTQLSLEGGNNSTEVAVVAFRVGTQPLPFRLTPESNTPRGVVTGRESGAAYALQWTLQAERHAYTLISDGGGGSVIVLRPSRLIISARGARPEIKTEFTIAQTPFPLHVVVAPAGGRGDPGSDIHLSFRMCWPRRQSPEEVCSNDAGPRSAGAPEPEGRGYDIEPVFPADPTPSSEPYAGRLIVEARRREALVGAQSFAVAVYPLVELSPQRPAVTLPEQGEPLGSGERGCAHFALPAIGRLPHPNQPTYALRVVLPLDLRSEPRLAGATFTLDGRLLEFASSLAGTGGHSFDAERLVGQHELCVQVGQPAGGDSSTETMFSLTFGFGELPYAGYPFVNHPLAVLVRIAPPGWAARTKSLVALSLALMTVVGMIWYGRDRAYSPVICDAC